MNWIEVRRLAMILHETKAGRISASSDAKFPIPESRGIGCVADELDSVEIYTPGVEIEALLIVAEDRLLAYNIAHSLLIAASFVILLHCLDALNITYCAFGQTEV